MSKIEEVINELSNRAETLKKIIDDYDEEIRTIQAKRQVAAQHLRFLKEDLTKTLEEFGKRNTVERMFKCSK